VQVQLKEQEEQLLTASKKENELNAKLMLSRNLHEEQVEEVKELAAFRDK